jgi:hypothetical protein
MWIQVEYSFPLPSPPTRLGPRRTYGNEPEFTNGCVLYIAFGSKCKPMFLLSDTFRVSRRNFLGTGWDPSVMMTLFFLQNMYMGRRVATILSECFRKIRKPKTFA